MSDFDAVLLAAGEVSKNQLPDGSYKRAVKMTPHERAIQANKIRWSRESSDRYYHGQFRGYKGTLGSVKRDYSTGQVANRGLKQAFDGYGVQHQIENARNAKTRPSKVHPNIEYGTSVGSRMEKLMDDTIRPDIAHSLKHKVVIHHGDLKMPGVNAAAAGSHKALLHGKGHVVVDHSTISREGMVAQFKPGITLGHMINHELGHATAHNVTPARFSLPDGKINARRARGEEARADVIGVHGPGLYRRTGVVGNRGTALLRRGILQAVKLSGKEPHHLGPGVPHGTTWSDLHEGLKSDGHYNDVHRKARLGRDGVKGLANDAKVGAALHPEKYVVGAAVTGAVAHHEWKKHHVNTADAAVAKARYNQKASVSGNTAAGGIVGAYLGAGIGAHQGTQHAEKLSDLRASYHNKMHARAVKQYASQKVRTSSPTLRTKRGKYGAFDDLSPKAKKVVTTAAKLKHVAATDQQFQHEIAPGAGALGGAVVGAAALGGLYHHASVKHNQGIDARRAQRAARTA